MVPPAQPTQSGRPCDGPARWRERDIAKGAQFNQYCAAEDRILAQQDLRLGVPGYCASDREVSEALGQTAYWLEFKAPAGLVGSPTRG